MTEFEKMSAGKLYDASEKELAGMRTKAHKLCKEYNDAYEDEEEKRKRILSELCPNLGKGTYLQGPLQFDYGVNFITGENCYANFYLVVLDCAPVTLGNDVFIGPNCNLVTPVHPLLTNERKIRFKADGTAYDLEYARPIVIEDGVWLASNVTVCGGVRIGKDSVIGAGSVVTRDIPEGVFAAGNPCRVIRKLTQEDGVALKKELY